MKPRSIRGGFALTDLTALCAILSVAAAVVAPGLQDAREAALRTQCKGHLKMLGLAMHNYHDAHGLYPPGIVDDNNVPTGGLATGFTLLLPFIEETALYNSFNFRTGEPPISSWEPNQKDELPSERYSGLSGSRWSHAANATTITREVSLFFCPTNRAAGKVQIGPDAKFVAGATDYGLCKGAIAALCGSPQEVTFPVKLEGYFTVNSKVRVKDVRDGTSLTVAMGEIAGGERFVATSDFDQDKPAESTALDGAGGTRGPKPWGVDQAWAVAWMQSAGDTAPYPRGAILIAANQHAGTNAMVDALVDTSGATVGDFPARINPPLVRQARIGKSGRAIKPLPGSTGNTRCTDMADRLPEARSPHGRVAQFLMGDGTVRVVKDDVDRRIYSFLFTIRGGEIIDEDDF
jgi:hypothetical protein